MIIFLFLIALSLSAFAQKCDQSDANEFYKCFEKAVPINVNDSNSDERNGTEYQNKVEECYTKNNCKPPYLNDRQRECLKSNFEKLQTCIDNKGDKFPNPSDTNGTLYKHWDVNNKDFGKGVFDGSYVDPKDCPAAVDVKACLKNLTSSNGKRKPDKKIREKIFNNICCKVKRCITRMPVHCQDSLNKTRSDVCDCSTAQKSDFNKCFSNKMFEEHVLKYLCEDPCTKGFHDDEGDDA